MIPVLVGREKNIRIAAANKNKAYLRRNTSFFCFYRLSYDQQGRSQPLKAKRLVLLVSKTYLNQMGFCFCHVERSRNISNPSVFAGANPPPL